MVFSMLGIDSRARYRAAAATSNAGAIWFHGGTSEPYNFEAPQDRSP